MTEVRTHTRGPDADMIDYAALLYTTTSHTQSECVVEQLFGQHFHWLFTDDKELKEATVRKLA